MHKIACFGDNCVDYYDQSQEVYYGGNPVNVAVYTQRLGFASSYIGVVGSDAFGKGLKKALLQKGVDCSHLRCQEGRTALTHVSIVNGDRVFGEYEEGVMASFSLTEEDISFIATHDAAVTGLWGHCEKQLYLLKQKGILVVFDASDRPQQKEVNDALASIDILFFSDDESNEEFLYNNMKALWKKGPSLVIATRGAKGSVLYDGLRFITQGIYQGECVDTMGAGDSFIAGFLNAYLCRYSLEACMQEAANQVL